MENKRLVIGICEELKGVLESIPDGRSWFDDKGFANHVNSIIDRIPSLCPEISDITSYRIQMEYVQGRNGFIINTTPTVTKLRTLIERLKVMHENGYDTQSNKDNSWGDIDSRFAKCVALCQNGDYAEGVEKSFKIVRERLRELTGYETASEAFGKGKLFIKGAAANHVEEDFNEGAKFLMMAIDRFRNEKSHTADGNIDNPVRAQQYLHMSSLALQFLDKVQIKP